METYDAPKTKRALTEAWAIADEEGLSSYDFMALAKHIVAVEKQKATQAEMSRIMDARE